MNPTSNPSVETLCRDLDTIARDLEAALGDVDSLKALEELRTRFLGKKGPISAVMRRLGTLSSEERPRVGQKANEIKARLEAALAEKRRRIDAAERQARLEAEAIDITLPASLRPRGSVHPVHQTLDEIVRIFSGMGFAVAEGPDIEEDWYNFEALNIPPDHPARDMHDTLYLGQGLLLRTHTSPVQIRVMQSQPPPVAIVCPGKVYRRDAPDASHSPMFHQIEGLLVDERVSFGHLKGVLEAFVHAYFGPDVGVRFRPSYFPFTEPSAEVDIQCVICGGRGCSVCKHTGWLEILGCGMVHPKVFEAVGYDPDKVTGFAFGMGADRMTMIKYGINDIRLFFENDVRFLGQF